MVDNAAYAGPNCNGSDSHRYSRHMHISSAGLLPNKLPIISRFFAHLFIRCSCCKVSLVLCMVLPNSKAKEGLACSVAARSQHQQVCLVVQSQMLLQVVRPTTACKLVSKPSRAPWLSTLSAAMHHSTACSSRCSLCSQSCRLSGRSEIPHWLA